MIIEYWFRDSISYIHVIPLPNMVMILNFSTTNYFICALEIVANIPISRLDNKIRFSESLHFKWRRENFETSKSEKFFKMKINVPIWNSCNAWYGWIFAPTVSKCLYCFWKSLLQWLFLLVNTNVPFGVYVLLSASVWFSTTTHFLQQSNQFSWCLKFI